MKKKYATIVKFRANLSQNELNYARQIVLGALNNKYGTMPITLDNKSVVILESDEENAHDVVLNAVGTVAGYYDIVYKCLAGWGWINNVDTYYSKNLMHNVHIAEVFVHKPEWLEKTKEYKTVAFYRFSKTLSQEQIDALTKELVEAHTNRLGHMDMIELEPYAIAFVTHDKNASLIETEASYDILIDYFKEIELSVWKDERVSEWADSKWDAWEMEKACSKISFPYPSLE